MKKVTVALFAIALLSACSTCYECYTEVPLVDANTGDTLDVTTSSEPFCTADPDEVAEREADGAVCEIQ